MAATMTDLADRRGVETELYQPAEDSHLLASVAVERIRRGDRILEVGCGSGYVAERVAETGASVVGSDVNPHACRATRDRGIQAVRGNLVDPFQRDSFDWVLFNPPYLPDHPDLDREDWLTVALTGGEDGRTVITAFLDDVARVLRTDGIALLVVSTVTNVDAVRSRAVGNGFAVRTVAEESYPFEVLSVLALEMS
jgi:release factor glutamine methyltransferase